MRARLKASVASAMMGDSTAYLPGVGPASMNNTLMDSFNQKRGLTPSFRKGVACLGMYDCADSDYVDYLFLDDVDAQRSWMNQVRLREQRDELRKKIKYRETKTATHAKSMLAIPAVKKVMEAYLKSRPKSPLGKCMHAYGIGPPRQVHARIWYWAHCNASCILGAGCFIHLWVTLIIPSCQMYSVSWIVEAATCHIWLRTGCTT